jgi:hypothetical protein
MWGVVRAVEDLLKSELRRGGQVSAFLQQSVNTQTFFCRSPIHSD